MKLFPYILMVFSYNLFAQQILHESQELKILQLKEHVFIHESYLTLTNGSTFPCNGLLYVNDQDAILFDTPVTDESARAILRWCDENKIELKGVIVNHFHEDCLGSLSIFHDQGINSYASSRTIKLADQNGFTIPKEGFTDSLILEIGGRPIINWFPGEAHSGDNIVSYLPTEKVLFGGCMVKALGAGKGNLADANVVQWSSTIQQIANSFPDVEIIVPGHGKPGNKELLSYTAQMFLSDSDRPILFFLHNRFLEGRSVEAAHDQYGPVEYEEMLYHFRKAGLIVNSEIRLANTDVMEYANKMVDQINRLIGEGVDPARITIIGTSKGGYIAQYISTYLANPAINFVFIACYQDSDIVQYPDINLCGNILNIYESSDSFGQPMDQRVSASTCPIEHFRNIRLDTGLGHGIVFQALEDWLAPTIQWAQGPY